MLAGLFLLETLSLALFATLLVRQQAKRVYQRAQESLEYDSTFLAIQAREAFNQNRPATLASFVNMMVDAPTIETAKITDVNGNVLFISSEYPNEKTIGPAERAQLPFVQQGRPRVFKFDGNRWEGVHSFYADKNLRGYAWVEFDRNRARRQMESVLIDTAVFGIIWLVASAVLVLLMARSIARPLAILHGGTRALMNSPESSGNFPLPVHVGNEIGDLIEAFNRMVASLAEQRAGLNDTLSLLDSMLANAPIGLAFFDRRCRFVRVNQVFAGMTGVPLSRHLGRTLPELLPLPEAKILEDTVLRVFAQEEPERNLELSGHAGRPARSWTWLVSAYPVRTTSHQVRWVGVIVLDASDRKRGEEALRKSEKLAATGRLAASIAHEINNPLEAITNLLFLLRNYCDLQDPALNYVTMAEHEARRISEITQQTLRFYRQSTLPTRARMADLLDSVLSLYHGRLNSQNIQVERNYDPEMDLFCFAGELRQVIANLVGNAIDASNSGGRLLVRARRSRSWKNPAQTGVRFAVADTGTGMDPEVRERAFEAFFTTKEATGTGLGLWVSHEIIMKHHGIVHVRSRTARHLAGDGARSGTVFQVFIPDDAALGAESKLAAVAKA